MSASAGVTASSNASQSSVRLAKLRYDYQRAKFENQQVIGVWFALVRNTRVKYGTVDDDVYNFDKTRLMMGVICACMAAIASEGQLARQ